MTIVCPHWSTLTTLQVPDFDERKMVISYIALKHVARLMAESKLIRLPVWLRDPRWSRATSHYQIVSGLSLPFPLNHPRGQTLPQYARHTHGYVWDTLDMIVLLFFAFFKSPFIRCCGFSARSILSLTRITGSISQLIAPPSRSDYRDAPCSTFY